MTTSKLMKRQIAIVNARRFTPQQPLIGYSWEPISSRALIGPTVVVQSPLFLQDLT